MTYRKQITLSDGVYSIADVEQMRRDLAEYKMRAERAEIAQVMKAAGGCIHNWGRIDGVKDKLTCRHCGNLKEIEGHWFAGVFFERPSAPPPRLCGKEAPNGGACTRDDGHEGSCWKDD